MNGPRRQQMQLRIGPPVTPDVIKWLLGFNIGLYLLQRFMPWIQEYGMLYPSQLFGEGAIWQLLTYNFLHATPMHLMGNMLVLWMFGSDVALHWGARRFLRFYALCGVGAGLLFSIGAAFGNEMGFTGYRIPLLGASAAIYGLFVARWQLWPWKTITLIFPPVTMQGWHMIPAFVLLDLIVGLPLPSIAAHLSGALIGYVMLWYWGVSAGPTLKNLKFAMKRRQRRARARGNLRPVPRSETRQSRGRDGRGGDGGDGGWIH